MALIPLNLEGADGADGADGPAGPAASVSVGTVTTLAAGSSATVTNGGTSSAAVLNFGIPRGTDGANAWSGPGYGSTSNLATGNTTPSSILVPAADSNYTFTINDATYSTSTDFQIRLPKPASLTTRHWLRITYIIRDRRRRVSHYMFNPDHAAFSAATFSPTVERGVIVEPNPEAGSVCTLDYEWDTTRKGWYVAAHSGDVSVRHYTPLGTKYGNELGLPCYVSPELATSSSSSDRLPAYRAAIEAIPVATRRQLGSRGVSVCMCLSGLDESFGTRNETSNYSDGLYQSHSYVTQAAGDAYGSAQLKGYIIQHELGHAMDFHYLAINGTPNGIDPLGDGLGTPDPGTLCRESDVYAAWLLVASSPYIRSTFSLSVGSVQEWLANIFMLAWAPRISGYAASAAWDAERLATVPNTGSNTVNTSAWSTITGYLQGIGALPTPLV